MANFLRNLIAGLSEQERRLVAIMGLVFFAFIIFLIVFFVQSSISDLEEENGTREELLNMLATEGQNYLERKQERTLLKSRVMSKPTPLRTLVDKIGKKLSVTVPDMKELPDQRHGVSWVEHAVELSMRQIGLANLTKFMEEVEGNRRRFPIAITKLEIRKRKRTEDTYDVKMVISTYEQSREEVTSGKRGKGLGRKGGH